MCAEFVEDHLDRRMGWIRGIDELEEFDEFAAAMAVLDQGVNLAGEQIDTGHRDVRGSSALCAALFPAH